MSIAKGLKMAREELDLSQAALAKELAVSLVTVNRWETDKCRPHSGKIKAVTAKLRRLHVSAACLAVLAEPLPPRYSAPKKQKMELILDNIDCAVALTQVEKDGKFSVLYANEALARLFADTPENVRGRLMGTRAAGASGEDVRRVVAAYQKTAQDGSPQQVTYLMNSGAVSRWVSLRTRAGGAAPDGGTLVYCTFADVSEQVSLQQAAQENAKALAIALDFSGVYSWVYDVRTGAIRPDYKLKRLLGVEMPELEPKRAQQMSRILPEYQPLYYKKCRELAAGAGRVELELQGTGIDGAKHWYRVRLCALSRVDGVTTTAIGTASKIDDEKDMRAQLQIERQRTRRSEDKLLGYVVTDLTNGRIIEHSQKAPNAPLCAKTQDFAQNVAEAAKTVVYEDQRKAFSALHDAAALLRKYRSGETGFSLDFLRLQEDGKIRWVRNVLNLLKNPATGSTLLYEYCYDIHDAKSVEVVADAAIELSFDCLASIDLLHNQYTFLNQENIRSGRRVVTSGYEEALQRYTTRVVVENQREAVRRAISLESVRDHLDKAATYEYTFHALAPDGRVHTMRNKYSYYDREKGRCLMIRTDVTELVAVEEKKAARLEAALAQADRASRAQSEFMSRMSHDLRTPMNAIIGISALTIDDAADPEIVRDNMTKLRSSADFMLGLMNDLLDMAKIERGAVVLAPEPYAFGDYITNLRTMFGAQCKAKDIALSLPTYSINPIVMADRTRSNQIFFNIMSNAVKYTPPGGKITYRVENVVIDEEKGVLSADHVIEDTGIGMSADFLQHVFEPFKQEDNRVSPELQGSGLGLAIVKQLVTLMGGTVTAQSEVGKGSCFTVHLDLPLVAVDAPAKKQERRPDDDFSVLRGRCVLMAEDHPLNAQIVRRLLEKQGISVLYAENGKAAVDKFAASENGEIDAVLMDIRMPVLSGLAAAEQIRALARPDAKTVPILAMSANAYPEDVNKSLQSGMNTHLAKPVEPATLYRTLAEWLARKEI